jgi:hypothetical protein
MITLKNRPTPLNLNQTGFAALVIAIVLVLLLSLMTIGFAELMRKETRSATDKHLSDQAYYAAETGINDAAKAINLGYTKVKPDCGPLTGSTDPVEAPLTSNKVGNDPNITYSCLLINPYPTTAEYGNIGTVPKYVNMVGVDPSNPEAVKLIRDLVISWNDSGGSHDYVESGGHEFDTTNGWGTKTGVLRVGVTPLDSGHVDRNYLIQNTYTAFFYPNKSNTLSSPPNNYSTDVFDTRTGRNSGAIINGNCNTGNRTNSDKGPRDCSVMITNVGHSSLLLSLRSIYRNSDVTFFAYGYDGAQLGIRNAQTVVDSTGKAQDVLRRVQVRIPTKNTYDVASDSLEVGSNICKQLELYPNDGVPHCSP